jgi:hypothetical protein
VTTRSSSTLLGTSTYVFINPANCKGNCTLDLPWPQTYETLSGLRAGSSLTVVITVTALSTTAIDGVPVTRYNATILQDVVEAKYAPPGTNLTLAQIGGSVNGTTMRVRGYPTLTAGGTYLVFLARASLASPFLNNLYGLDLFTIGGPQGLFYVANGNVYSIDNMYPQDDAWLPVKVPGIPLAQFIQQVQATTTTTSSVAR